MTPLPPPLRDGELNFWRIDAQMHRDTWDSGEGSFRVGGRWNSVGVRAVYTCLDPATAILEVAVHKGFKVLDTQPHTLTCARVIDPSHVTILKPDDVPNPNWLAPCTPNSNQQKFGDDLLQKHRFVILPSAVSKNSWNLIFDAGRMAKEYDRVIQQRSSIDPRLQL
ncbi:MAG: RES domain-containing protein [Pseudomonadota bacterium]